MHAEIAALIEKWREEATTDREQARESRGYIAAYAKQDAETRQNCADELEALLVDLARVEAPTVDQHDTYWLYRLAQAIEGIEEDAICRIDVDIPAASEVQRIKTFVGVLQDYAHGYDEDGPQPRLSLALFRLLDTPVADPVRPLAVPQPSNWADEIDDCAMPMPIAEQMRVFVESLKSRGVSDKQSVSFGYFTPDESMRAGLPRFVGVIAQSFERLQAALAASAVRGAAQPALEARLEQFAERCEEARRVFLECGGVKPAEEQAGFASTLRDALSALRSGATLPDVEAVSALVHDSWVEHQRERGVTSSISRHTGEEQMAPYAQLSETVKESDRRTVLAVYAAIQQAHA